MRAVVSRPWKMLRGGAGAGQTHMVMFIHSTVAAAPPRNSGGRLRPWQAALASSPVPASHKRGRAPVLAVGRSPRRRVHINGEQALGEISLQAGGGVAAAAAAAVQRPHGGHLLRAAALAGQLRGGEEQGTGRGGPQFKASEIACGMSYRTTQLAAAQITARAT